MECQKTSYLDALCRKGIYLCRLYVNKNSSEREVEDSSLTLKNISSYWTALLKFIDPTDKVK